MNNYELVFAYPSDHERCSEAIERMERYVEEALGLDSFDRYDLGRVSLAYPIRYKYDRRFYSAANFIKMNFTSASESIPKMILNIGDLEYEPLRFLVRKRRVESQVNIIS